MSLDHHTPPRKFRHRRNLRLKTRAIEKDKYLGRIRVAVRDQYRRLRKRWKLSEHLENVKD